MTDTLRDRLLAHDAEPAAPLTPFEQQRHDALLRSVLASDDRLSVPVPARPQPRTRARLIGVLAGAATVGLIAATLVAGPRLLGQLDNRAPSLAASGITTAQLSSWTGTAVALDHDSPLGAAATSWCLSATSRGPGSGTPTIANADLRGTVASMIVDRGGDAAVCMTAGADDGFWQVIDEPSSAAGALSPGGVMIDTAGSHGDGSTGFNYLVGFAGTDISSIAIKDDSVTVVATLQAGRWTAWWPSTNPDGGLGGTIVMTSVDGSSRTVSADSLVH